MTGSLGADSLGTRPASRAPFVGREPELSRLRESVAGAADAIAQLIAVTGPAGIGRTALLRRTVGHLPGHLVLLALCDPHETELPFEVVKQLLGQLPPDTVPEEAQAPLRDCLSTTAQPSVPQVGAALLHLLVELQHLLPVVVVIEDAQWADTGSLHALGYMQRRLLRHRVLTVLDVRTHEPGETLLGRGDHQAPDTEAACRRLIDSARVSDELCLRGLTVAELTELAELVLGAKPDPVTASRLHGHTLGHPAYAHDLLRDMRLQDTDTPLSVPSRFLGTVRTLLADLPAASRDLLDGLAVLNTRARLGLAAQVSGVAEPAAALEPLLDTGLVRWWPSDPASPVEFRHPMYREAIYHLIPPKRRGNWHRTAAGLVDRAASWVHRVAAATGVDESLAGALDNQATSALAECDVDLAVRFLLWASDLSGSLQQREHRLLTAVVHCLWWNRMDTAQRLRAAVDQCTPSALRTCALGLFAIRAADVQTSQNRLTEVVNTVATVAEPVWLKARALASLAAAHLAQGHGDLASWYADRALRDERADSATVYKSVHYLVLGKLCQRTPDEALEALHAVAGELDHAENRIQLEISITLERSLCHLLAGRTTVAMRTANAPIPLLTAPRTGPCPQTYSVLAAAQYFLGHWGDALANVYKGLEIQNAGEQEWQHLPLRAVATLLSAGRGDWEAADRHLDSLRHSDYAVIGWHREIYQGIASAGLAQARYDHQGMIDALDRVRRFADHADPTNRAEAWQGWWRPMLIEGLIGTGQLPDARTELDILRAGSLDSPFSKVTVAWLSGWLHHRLGDIESARLAYEQALDAPADDDDVALHRARLEQGYGHLLHSTRDRRNAISWLRRAAVRFSSLQAHPFVDRCAASLTACGLQPEARPVVERPTLTERERQVADLVACGLTNHQAAVQLFVSDKTVEYHLGNVYTKLGISSRRQLRNHPALDHE